MIELDKVAAGYGGTPVLEGVDLRCPDGAVTAVIGRNGCGKSTLLKSILGIVPLSGGQVALDGVSTRGLSPRQIARRAAYLAQGKNVPQISAYQLVLHGRFPYLSYPRRYGKEDRQIAMEAMEAMDIGHLAAEPLERLSGGTRQKVYIAMALCQQAGNILMDEPTTYLDIGQQLRLAELVRDLAREGKTVVLVIHDILLALKTADRIAVMDQGRIAQVGTPPEILDSGILSRVFGVDVRSMDTPQGLEYYYAP